MLLCTLIILLYCFYLLYFCLHYVVSAGNVVILKLPTVRGLVHMLTMEAYAEHLPAGVMTFVSGAGRVTVSPLMKSGAIDILGKLV